MEISFEMILWNHSLSYKPKHTVNWWDTDFQ